MHFHEVQSQLEEAMLSSVKKKVALLEFEVGIVISSKENEGLDLAR